jgi:hypothetical protein
MTMRTQPVQAAGNRRCRKFGSSLLHVVWQWDDSLYVIAIKGELSNASYCGSFAC